ncbi:MAG TPA: rod shape-determining protein RodA [Bacillota bacterium]|nr:rod shape-determining protein RodA [Bacillota bacterium]HQD76766.1 rod shape-determining protein RodA [Bacillota bacterium]HUM58739.1 rod shape-determining protein RodA [Bacillota bacterium]
MFMQSRMLKKIDYTILFTVIIIISYSLIIIYSATKPVELLSMAGSQVVNQDPLGVVKKQVLNVMLGFVAMAVLLCQHYENLSKHVKLFYVVNLIMLASVIFMGHSALGATRWIEIGSFRFQPSEFAKLIIIICFAAFLVPRVGKLNRMRDLLPCFAFFVLPLGLILKQPDLGTSLVFLAIMFGMLFAAGARPLLLISLIVGGLGTVSLWIWAHFWLLANRGFNLWVPLKDYQLERLLIFIDPWKDPLGDGYHVIQSQIAIGQGGLFGRGLFQGSQTHGNFLPIQETDFIFSVVGEEFGFVGAVFLLALFFILIYRCIYIAVNAKDDFGYLLTVGVISMITFHVLVNVGMTTGVMPVTGIPLPMFSYGGSNMITNLAAIGLVLNINMRRQKILF